MKAYEAKLSINFDSVDFDGDALTEKLQAVVEDWCKEQKCKIAVVNLANEYFDTPPAEEDELWKLLDGYDIPYEISNYGNLRYISGRHVRQHEIYGGYKRACLRKDGKSIVESIHHLVARAFIPNPNNYFQVSHLNRQKWDNRVENLAWVSARSSNRRAVIVHNTKGEFVGHFETLTEAAKLCGIRVNEVSVHARNKKPYKEYVFTYADEI